MNAVRVIQVNYDLHRPVRDYARLWDYLKRKDGIRFLKSQWLIRTTKDAHTVMEEVHRLVDADDEIYVFDVTGDEWWTNSGNQTVVAWMYAHMDQERRAA